MKVRYGGNKRVFAILMILGLLVSFTLVGLANNKTPQCEERIEDLRGNVSQIAEVVAELENQVKKIKNLEESVQKISKEVQMLKETLERKYKGPKEEVKKLRNQVDKLKNELEKTRANQAVIATSWFQFAQFYDSYIKNTGTAFVPNKEWNKVRKYALTISGVDISLTRLGVDVKTVDDKVAQEHNLTVRRGAFITRVYENTPARASGLREGDVILKVDDKKVKNAPQFLGIVWSSAPGTRLELETMRNGEFNQVQVFKLK